MKKIAFFYCYMFISSVFDKCFYIMQHINILCSLGDFSLFHGYKYLLLTPRFPSLIIKLISNYLFQHYVGVKLFEFIYTKLNF